MSGQTQLERVLERMAQSSRFAAADKWAVAWDSTEVATRATLARSAGLWVGEPATITFNAESRANTCIS